METHQHRVVILLARRADRDAPGHRPPDLFHSVRRPVAAQDPDDALLAVSLSQEFAVSLRAGRREDRLVVARIPDYPAPPCRQKTDVDAIAIGLVDNIV